jgi:hypothetical protein
MPTKTRKAGNEVRYIAAEGASIWTKRLGMVRSGCPLHPHDAQSGIKVYLDV